jgi:mannose-6-phosphate isomerase-like protein (cupin superfamily)
MRRIGLKRHEVFTVPKGYVHRLESKKGGVLAEIAAGKFDEADIIRLEDDYDRHLVAMGSGRKGR